jgi:hypothetical protein
MSIYLACLLQILTGTATQLESSIMNSIEKTALASLCAPQTTASATSEVAQAKEDEYDQEVRVLDTRPHRVSGATSTSWSGPPHIDLPKQFFDPSPEVTITGSAQTSPKAIVDRNGFDGELLLSDGIHITFATVWPRQHLFYYDKASQTLPCPIFPF